MIAILLLVACSGGPDASDRATPTAPDPDRPKLQVGVVGSDPTATPEPAEAVLKAGDCQAVEAEPPPSDGCISGTLSCGSEVVGHTEGGAQHFDTRFYEQNFCTPATTGHDGGGERIYRLELPEGDWHADVWLDTPCADLDLAAFRWEGAGCPDKRSRIDVCEMNRLGGTKREHVRVASRGPTTWLVVVEGEGEAEGPFGLKVTCSQGL